MVVRLGSYFMNIFLQNPSIWYEFFSWEGIKEADINEYKSHAKQENLDIEFV